MDIFFLLMASSQFIPFLRIGLIYTYWGPLMFVTFVTMCREGFDDFSRYRRDKEVNSSKYSKLTSRGTVAVASSDIKVRFMDQFNTFNPPMYITMYETTKRSFIN